MFLLNQFLLNLFDVISAIAKQLGAIAFLTVEEN